MLEGASPSPTPDPPSSPESKSRKRRADFQNGRGRASEDRLLEKATRKLAKATFVGHGVLIIKGVVIQEKWLNLRRIECLWNFKLS